MLSDAEVCYSDNPSEVEGHNVNFSPDSELSEEEGSARGVPSTAFVSTSSSPIVGTKYVEDEEDDVYDESRDEEDEEEDEDEDEDEDSGDGDTPSSSKQKKIMKLLELNQPTLTVGDFWYLIDIQWFRRWKQYVKYDWSSSGVVSRPGSITNEGLLEPNTDRVSRSLIEHSHYAIISKQEWEHLVSWYGGGPEIARPVISTGPYNKSVEVRKLDLVFIKSSEPEETVKHEFSKTTTVKKMKEEMCEVLGLEEDNIRVWDYHNKRKSQLLENPDKTLSECTIIHNQYLLFEEKLENGEFAPTPTKAPSYSSGYSTNYSSGGYSSSWGNSYSYQNRGKEPTDPGLCGLSNLGNTCFMNSSLQSLSNCPILTSFFLSGEYKKEINRDNPIGTGGKLVEQYATLLRDMWSGEYKFIAPREFKHKLETFAPQFQGMQQHDSQELLGFLLDGLHEDLNRVKNKPYIELKEAEGREDSIVAAEAWENHLARNDSKIVDLYHGQLKSKLTCPDCDRVSVTFDPCMYLSLPLPMETTREMKVKILLQDPMLIPLERKVIVPKDGSISDLKASVSELCDIPTDNLAVIEIWNHKIYKVYSDSEAMDRMQDKDDVCVCFVDSPEVSVAATKNEDDDEPTRPTNNYGSSSYYNYYKPKVVEHPDDIIHLQVVLRKKEKATSTYYYRPAESFGVFGTPMIISCRRGSTYEEIHEIVAQKLSRFFDDPSVLDFPEASEVDSGMDIDEVGKQENTAITSQSSMESSLPDSENVVENSAQSSMDDGNDENAQEEPVAMETTIDEPAAVVSVDTNQAQSSIDNNSDDNVEGENVTQSSMNGNENDSEDDTVSEGVDDYLKDNTSEQEEKSELYPNFFLQILDSSAQRKLRDLDFGEEINFSAREILSVTFTDELVQLYKQTEEERIEKELIQETEDDDDDKDDSIDLADCLNLYTVAEKLGPDDPWYCNKCKDQKQATKKFDFWKFPPLLVIHLKRFSYKNRYRRDKIDTVVNFPLKDLDLSDHMLNPEPQVPPIYDLMAVSNHFGALGGGHYTAFAKNANDEKWYKFDDSAVSPVNENKICSSAAYVLFYRRKDVESPVDHLQYDPAADTSVDAKDEEEDEDVEETTGNDVVEDEEDEDRNAGDNDIGCDNSITTAHTPVTEAQNKQFEEDYESESEEDPEN